MDDVQFRRIIAKARDGQESAIDELIASCDGLLRREIAGHMDGVLGTRLQMEDVLQEIYAAAWQKMPLGEFENASAFVGWLKAIAKNKLIDLRRRLKSNRRATKHEVPAVTASAGSCTTFLEQFAAHGTTPSSSAARREALAVMMSRLGRLRRDHEDYWLVLQLRFIQGLSVAEVADRLGRSEGAVHMLCHRALKAIHEIMGAPSKYFGDR